MEYSNCSGHRLTTLITSGINFTSIREGIYTDAFPVFIGRYPSTSTVYLPSDGPIAFTLNAKLGEATARLMIFGGHDKEIVLLTAKKAAEIADAIDETTGREVQVKLIFPDGFMPLKGVNDKGGKPEAFFHKFLSCYQAIARGTAGTVDLLTAEVLGKEPVTPRETIRGFLRGNGDYEWHPELHQPRLVISIC